MRVLKTSLALRHRWPSTGSKGISLENFEKDSGKGFQGLSALGPKELEKESKASRKHGKNLKMSVRSQKEPQSQRIARAAPKNFLNNSRALPNKTRVLRQIAPESSPESSAKFLSQKFSGVPFLSLRVGLRFDTLRIFSTPGPRGPGNPFSNTSRGSQAYGHRRTPQSPAEPSERPRGAL